MVTQITPAKNTGIITGKCRRHLDALMAVNAVKFAFIAPAFSAQFTFCPMAGFDTGVIADNFILLFFKQECNIGADHNLWKGAKGI